MHLQFLEIPLTQAPKASLTSYQEDKFLPTEDRHKARGY